MPFHGVQGVVHSVVVWLRIGTDRTARPILSDTALELKCRWDSSTKTVLDTQGNSVSIDATISGFSIHIPIGSAVWKGTIDDIPGTSEIPVLDVMEVVTVTDTEDIRGRDTYREATLVRQKDTL